MEIKCIITDDEPIARKGLRRHIGKIDFLTVIGECEDAVQLNAMLSSVRPDLLFLDIEMPHLSGLELLANLQNPPKVIITSAYEQYALKGYEFDVVDYLLKPIPFARFLKSVNKAHAMLEAGRQTEAIRQAERMRQAEAIRQATARTQKGLGEQKTEEPYLFVKTEKLLKKIFLKDILFIESLENYIVVHTPFSHDIVSVRLKTMLETLPGDTFRQVHRSFIVNLSAIRAIDGNLLLIGEHKIPVARPFREEVYKAIINNTLVSR